MNRIALAVLSACATLLLALPLDAQQGPPPPVVAKPEELAQIRGKSEQIEAIVTELKARGADAALIGDVAVYAHAGRMLLEFPELFGTQTAIDHAMETLDSGVEKAKQLQAGQSPWTEGPSRIYAYTSEIDGSLQPYHVSLPANYDPSKPVRLYVWLHGRQNNTTEAAFIYGFDHARPGNPAVADNGQIQIDLFGRLNSAGWHWAGEADVFEAIAAVKKRFRIDDSRVLLRGFSMGGEGAWNIALHYPDRFAAAEIGAGTWSRRPLMSGLQPWQYPTLNIWENMEQWALNGYNLPIAGHDGDKDDQIPFLPGPAPAPNHGQLESSLRVKAQMEREGYPAMGFPNFLRLTGTPDIFLISADTGHGTSPLVRTQLDAFLKEWGDRGQSSPDHIRFVTFTTRYNSDYWVQVDAMERLYERADVDAMRSPGGLGYTIKTHNVARLVLKETAHAGSIAIDGQTLKVKAAATITLRKTGTAWRVDVNGALPGLHKVHALQGPIDDAFLDPFLLVRPTGTPWNAAVNDQALRTLARFDRLWAKYFRGHPFVKDDKDVTAADIAKYHLVLFGDPGSNTVMARLAGKLPVKWTKQSVTLGAQSFPAAENFPALVYPNPLNPKKYVVVNTGLTISEREYNGDYGMPLWGDYAVLKVHAAADVPDLVTAGYFNNNWRLDK